jgi:DNA-directed RNA polymerase subunit N (RpoN/RPB10)
MFSLRCDGCQAYLGDTMAQIVETGRICSIEEIMDAHGRDLLCCRNALLCRKDHELQDLAHHHLREQGIHAHFINNDTWQMYEHPYISITQVGYAP